MCIRDRGEMDPTMVMSMCYVFLFGLMLSDAAYGLIITVACFWALKRFPRMDENLRKSVRLFFYCGISTLFWGCLLYTSSASPVRSMWPCWTALRPISKRG